jgi:hypothetical protein
MEIRNRTRKGMPSNTSRIFIIVSPVNTSKIYGTERNPD